MDDKVESVAADTTSSDPPIPSYLPPLPPNASYISLPPTGHFSPALSEGSTTPKFKPIGTVHPFKDTIETDPSKLTLKELPPPHDSLNKGVESLSGPVDSTSLSINTSSSSSELTPPNSLSFKETEEKFSIYDPPLPGGKRWHIFISHSTSDQQWVHESLIVPLQNEPERKVTASYHFMPDSSCYDDKEIQRAMRESCVIIISLSPKYINSPRCHRESKFAVHLSSAKKCIIIVVAVETCSRPPHLKQYLYLDFIDRTKRSTVWKILEETLESSISKQRDTYISGSSSLSEKSSLMLHDIGQVGSHDEFDLDPTYQYSLAHAFETAIQDFGETTRERKISEEESENEDRDEVENTVGKEIGSEGGSELESKAEREIGSEEGGGKLGSEVEREMGSESEGGSEVGGENDEDSGGHKSRGDIERKRARLKETPEEGEVIDSSDTDSELKNKKPKVLNEDDDEGVVSSDNETLEQSEMIQKFYNKLAEPGADNRNESPILHMRSFNNWVKSVLIRSYLNPYATVLDLCCGKGGDLNKWKEGRIQYLVCADISDTSIEQCKERYSSNRITKRSGKPPFEAEFITADCCQTRLQDVYENPARRFNMASCQFSLHYSFESYDKAHMMLQNACENLRPGAYFIGTTVDSYELIRRLRVFGQQNDEGHWTIGNEIYTVTLEFSPHEQLPLFGCKYHFKLAGVVNLPEFVVHYPLLVHMLKEFDMEEVAHQNFYDFFSEHKFNPEDAHLLFRMKAFDKDGSMSALEWEAIGLYLIFVFQKR